MKKFFFDPFKATIAVAPGITKIDPRELYFESLQHSGMSITPTEHSTYRMHSEWSFVNFGDRKKVVGLPDGVQVAEVYQDIGYGRPPTRVVLLQGGEVL